MNHCRVSQLVTCRNCVWNLVHHLEAAADVKGKLLYVIIQNKKIKQEM